MTTKSILQAFENYQKSRVSFVQTIADLSTRTAYTDCLLKYGALELLPPLLSDPVPQIQQLAALAMGRLANNNKDAAFEVIKNDMVPRLLQCLDGKSKYYKKSAMFVLRGVAKQSPELAFLICQSGGIDAILSCLEEFDPGIKEAAAWALSHIAKHNIQLAQACAASGAVPMLKLCLLEPEVCLKQIAALALSEVAKHSTELAQTLVDSGCVPCLVKCISNPDAKLKRQAMCTLSNVAKHLVDQAEVVVEAEVFPEALQHMGHPDINVRKAAATLTSEIVKHNLQMAQMIVNSGGIAAYVEMMSMSEGDAQLPAIMGLGFIGAQSEQLALAAITSKVVPALDDVLTSNSNDTLKAASVWALGHIGKHSAEHAKSLALGDVFLHFVECYSDPNSSQDLKNKCKISLKMTLTKCMHIPALEPLLYVAPHEILKYVLGQYSKILPTDSRGRRMFVMSGSLKKIQEIHPEPGTALMEYINIINCCFPPEIIRYYSPGYPDALLKEVDQFTPQIPPLFPRDMDIENGEEETFDDNNIDEKVPDDWDTC